MIAFAPADWNWIVAGDASRAWSSASRDWVASWPEDRQTRIASLAELDEVLRHHGQPSPVVSASDVRAEAQRRIIRLTGAADFDGCVVRQLNATMRAMELTSKRAVGLALTPAEEAEAAALQALADAIKSIRARSNALEPAPPPDPAADRHWA